MIRTDRFRTREDELNKAFVKAKMKALWNGSIRSTLRNQPIKDLHDHYDFHLHLDTRIETIISSVRTGTYQPTRSLRIRSEKNLGIPRHLVFVNPTDALVLETLGAYLEGIIRKQQPSKNAFYSRNQTQPKSPSDVDDTFGYPWWILWPEFQKRILEFAEEKEFVVVTDVAAYYDNIDFSLLRNYLASLGHFSEIFLDFLFFLLERFAWRPDYLPFLGKGLPQINLDTPRLIAHAFLFEIDEFLKTYTGDNFVRWLDDIDFGCNSKEDAKLLLRNIDELLLSRGLHLNSSKTKILTQKEAHDHFHLDENRFLTIITRAIDFKIPLKVDTTKDKKFLRRRFRSFIKKGRNGQWSKILKRFYTAAAKLEDPFLESFSFKVFSDCPELRDPILRYFKIIGWSYKREFFLKKYLFETLDDDSFFGIIEVLLIWRAHSSIQYLIRQRTLAYSLTNKKSLVKFIGALWLMGKFGSTRDIDNLITTNTVQWKSDDWVGRQVAALWPRMEDKTKEGVLNVVHAYGLTSAKLVIDNYTTISSSLEPNLISKVTPFITAPTGNNTFPLPKILIALSYLSNSSPLLNKVALLANINSKLKDPVYKLYINKA